MFFFIFFDISSLLFRYITPAIPRSSRLDLSKNILKNIDSYLNFRTLVNDETKLFKTDFSASTMHSTQYSNLRIQNSKLRIQNSKLRIQNSEFKIQNYKCITSPYAAAVASMTASLIVGCG